MSSTNLAFIAHPTAARHLRETHNFMKRLLLLTMSINLIFGTVVGCTTRSDFTALSSKNINLASIKVHYRMGRGDTRAEACQQIITIIPVGSPATLGEAVDRALEPKHANLLLNAVVNHHWFYVPFIYGRDCWHVDGVAYDTYN